jgi:hypothetical protein
MTMHFITSQTVTGSAAQLTFNNIPQTFNHLHIKVFGRHATANSINASFVQINSFGGAYPAYNNFAGNGTSAASGASTSSIIPLPSLPGTSASANMVGSFILDILDYSSTIKRKTVRSFGGVDLNGSGSVGIHIGFGPDNAAITNLILGAAFTAPYTFAVGTRVDIYGITTNSIATGA